MKKILFFCLFLFGAAAFGEIVSQEIKPEDLKLSALNPKQGYISFFIKLPWNGDDGKHHGIFLIGNGKNGFGLEKSELGFLRLISFSKEGKRVARADVRSWKVGEWHHIAFAWFSNKDGVPLGLPLYVDTYCADGPVPRKSDFFENTGDNPAVFAKDLEWLGLRYCGEEWSRWGKTSDCYNLIAMVYRDYFRNLPVQSIKIVPTLSGVRANPALIKGAWKLFGLEAEVNGNFIPVTDEMRKYGNWSEYDAKPFIKWETENSSVASVVSNNLIKGVAQGKTKLTATYQGKTASYDLLVKDINQPDLSILYTSILPRYSHKALKTACAPGDVVTSIVHVANYGYQKSSPATKVRFRLYESSGLDFNPEAKVLFEKVSPLPELEGLEKAELEFVWTWPETPVFIEAVVEEDALGDLNSENNFTRDLNVARPLRFGFPPELLTNYYNAKAVNALGSFSLYDWVSSHKYKMDNLLREAKYPLITPNGITDTYRIDNIFFIYREKNEKQPFYELEEYYDGGFPIYANDIENKMECLDGINAAIVHELGHTCLGLPDVYGYPMRTLNFLLKDDKGKPYAGTHYMPDYDGSIMCSGAQNVPCGARYSSLMDGCHMWINPSNAGKIEYCKGSRGETFWGVQGRLIPMKENKLHFLDRDDKPLAGAAVYVYHVTHPPTQAFADKYFADCPKFAGQTDADGCFIIGGQTLNTWDCPETDRVEGQTHVWNPFGQTSDKSDATCDTAFTPNVYTAQGLLLIKIVTDEDTEFQLLPMTAFNEEYFRGHRFRGLYDLRTNLISSKPTPVQKKELPKKCQKRNLRPVAKLAGDKTEFELAPGEEITLDASPSSDPEGQALSYRWHNGGDWYSSDLREGVKQTYKAPEKVGEEKKIDLFVLDGLRASNPLHIKLKAVGK